MPFCAYATQLLSLSTTNAPTEQITGLAKLIQEYGTEVVIISVFLIVIIAFFLLFLRIFNKFANNSLKQNEKMLDILMRALNVRLDDNSDGSQSTTIKKSDKAKEKSSEADKDNKEDSSDKPQVKEPERKYNIVSNNNYINEIFDEVSRNVMGDLKCNRVAVYVFHNGNKTPYGYSFVKMTCIHEKNMKSNMVLRGENHQGLPIHAFSTIVDCLIRNGEYIIGNVYNHGIISADEQLLTFIDGSKVKALFALAVKDNNGEVAGFIIAEFNDEQDFSNPTWYNKARTSLKHMADVIRPVIIDNNFRSYYESKDKDAT